MFFYIVDKNGSAIEVTLHDFLKIDMHGKVILNVKLPPLSRNHRLVTFKVHHFYTSDFFTYSEN